MKKKKQVETEPQLFCEVCNENNIAVAILKNGKFACRLCAENPANEVLRWLK